MMSFSAGVCGLAVVWGAGAIASPSAARLPGETFEQARTRTMNAAAPSFGVMSGASDAGTRSALDSAVPWNQLDFSKLPLWWSPEVEEGFEQIRDPRFLPTTVVIREPCDAGVDAGGSPAGVGAHPGCPRQVSFPRRQTWLDPRDGCWVRAEVATQRLTEFGYARPAKVFVFGTLTVKTPNAPSGQVSWWYHVVPVVRIPTLFEPPGPPPVTDWEVFVLDPAIEPAQPLRIADWVLRMVPNLSDVKVALCSPFTFDPNSPCEDAAQVDETTVLREQANALGGEWILQGAILQRNVIRVLGDYPPWAPDGGFPDGGW